MNKILWPLAFGIVIFLVSCSTPQSVVLTSQEDTIRSAVIDKNFNTNWTEEIEAEKLNRKINQQVQVLSNDFISTDFLNTITSLQPAVYPEIKGFASLDCSSMDRILYDTVSEVCDVLCSGTENLETYFDTQYFYNCVFFIKDFNDEIKDKFNDLKDSKRIFDKYYICKGFEGNELIQVPVRFYKDKETLDLSIYLTYHGGYKVIQIEILGWGKIYGESE